MNFDETIDENWKFEILNPKVQNLTKSQNLKSLTLKSKIFNFDKIWQKMKIPPRWFIITLNEFSSRSNFAIPPKFESRNFPKFVPIWANTRYKIFSKIWSR